jgi:hypothetical protein
MAYFFGVSSVKNTGARRREYPEESMQGSALNSNVQAKTLDLTSVFSRHQLRVKRNETPPSQLPKQYNASNESPFTAKGLHISEATVESDEVAIQLPSPSFRIEVASTPGDDQFRQEVEEDKKDKE